jgi:very-short-patch-repair endonuclease
VWRDHHLIAELDGHASHATTAGFERDRARDRALQAAGWRVIRITWRQLHDQPAAVARDLERLLNARGVT